MLLGAIGGTFVGGGGPYSVGGDFNAVGLTSGNLDPGGDPEILTANAFGDNVSVLPGATGGSFGTAEPHVVSGPNDAPYDVVARDLNGDGDPEIVASGDDTDVSSAGRAGASGRPRPSMPAGPSGAAADSPPGTSTRTATSTLPSAGWTSGMSWF